MSDNKIYVAIENIVDKLSAELLGEVEDDTIQDYEYYSLENSDKIVNTTGVFKLSELAFSHMDELKVSRLSIFGDDTWDWRQEGSALYKDDCINYWNKVISERIVDTESDTRDKMVITLLDNETKPLYRLIKMIAFYYLPQNACLKKNISSYNTTKSFANKLTYLAMFLYGKGKFVDNFGNGSFDNATYLSEEDFSDFLENKMKSPNQKVTFVTLANDWRALSTNKLIPVEFRIDFDPFSKDKLRELSKNAQISKKPFLPIPLEALSILVSHSIKLVENYSKDIFKMYEILLPLFSGASFDWNEALDQLIDINPKIFDIMSFRFTNYHEVKFGILEKKKIYKAIKNHPDWHEVNSSYPSFAINSSNKMHLDLCEKLGIDLEQLDKKIMYNLRVIRNEAGSIVTALRNACVVILFLTTGMRTSEMYLLETGDCWKDKGSEDDYRIKISVSKTSEGSSGLPVVLPIPAIGFKAFMCLQSLTERARIYGETNKLLVNVIHTGGFGKETNKTSIRRFISHWCEDLGIEHIHPHQFRKTIAMFAIYQNPNNISIIRRLFSHKSLAMTLAYIIKMPSMSKEIKLAVMEQNKELIAELLEAIESGVIAGIGGERIQKTVQESKIFTASLHHDGWEPYEQYIESLLENGINILHRTSYNAICLNTHSGLLHLGPEECNCNVVDCDWAAFTKSAIDDLETDIKAHQNFLSKKHSKEQGQYSHYIINKCIERLIKLKGLDVVSNQYPELVNMGA